MNTTEENECYYRKYCILFKPGVLHESLKGIIFLLSLIKNVITIQIKEVEIN